ncbi:putative ribonuclease H-like domain-containing protein [Tanacetum coccineum]
MTHPNPKRNIVPRAVLMRKGLVPLTTARPVNTVQPRPTVNGARQMSNVFNKAHSSIRRTFNNLTAKKNSNFYHRVNNVKGSGVNTARPKAILKAVKGNLVNVVKASACWVWRAKQKVLDHVSKHNSASTTWQSRARFKLMDDLLPLVVTLEEGRLQGKVKNKTGNLDFKDVYFVKELKFNLFSVSQMCDKKNSVLFTDTECFVLSPDFKLTDESHVLLKVPRKDNMYSVDLKNIVPNGGLTCLFAKATSDESKLWHRRLGHINFKTLNKLVKGNLVRGLPSKLFEINQTYIACQKGKQHGASCKSKSVSSISKPVDPFLTDLT